MPATDVVEISSLASAISIASGNDYFVGYRNATGVGATNTTFRFPVSLLPLAFNSRIGKIAPAAGDYTATQITETSGHKILTAAERVKLTPQTTQYGTTGLLDANTATGIKLWSPLVLSNYVIDQIAQITTSGLASAIENTLSFATDYFLVTTSASGTVFNISFLASNITATGDGVGYDEIAIGGTGVTKQALFNFPNTYFTASNNVGATRTDVGFLATKLSLASHNHSTVYSALGHNHSTVYSALGHNHSTVYSALGHNHATSYSALAHTHATTYAPISGSTAYSAAGHNHDSSYQTKAINVNFSWSGKPVAGSTRSVINSATSDISFGTGQSAINLKALASVAPAVTRSFRLRTSSNGSTWSNKQLINFVSGETTGSIVSGGTTGFNWLTGYILQMRGPTASDANMAGIVMGIRGTQS